MAASTSSKQALVSIDLQGKLKPLASGKVRELFELDAETLLFVATDRISAFDVIMKNGIPEKGALLTTISQFWFTYLSQQIPTLRTHLIASGLPASTNTLLSAETLAQVNPRAMQVRRLEPFALESIVRGYITGSAWSEYKRAGTVHGIQMPEGLREGDKLPKAIWTPSTKAEVGGKDENLHPDQAKDIVGVDYAKSIEALSVELYEKAHEYAFSRGIIIADTKFELAPDPENTANFGVILIDEVLTPDSSRFWPQDTYKVGGAQPSFDKQFLRDWLIENGLKGKEGVEMPDEVVSKTAEKYEEAFRVLTGEKWKTID